MGKALNYLGQLRPYSYADLLLLFVALDASTSQVLGLSLLWFGFLTHLEWRHRDVGRARWPWYVWVTLWVAAAAVLRDPQVIPFFALATGYSLKKRYPALAAVSPLLNGGLKVALVIPLQGADQGALLVVLALMTVRNLLGDVRDAEKDHREGVRTLPVRLGYTRRTPWVYPLFLAATSAVWAVWGGVGWGVWVAAVAVQAATYHLTPR